MRTLKTGSKHTRYIEKHIKKFLGMKLSLIYGFAKISTFDYIHKSLKKVDKGLMGGPKSNENHMHAMVESAE